LFNLWNTNIYIYIYIIAIYSVISPYFPYWNGHRGEQKHLPRHHFDALPHMLQRASGRSHAQPCAAMGSHGRLLPLMEVQ
jgi:hypothetical protein